jgi:hypothetical protein
LIGYHLTSEENWLRIQEQGIQPYRIKDHEPGLLTIGFEAPVMGVWVWVNRLDELSEHLNVIWHVSRKQTKIVVVLGVQYAEEDHLRNREGLTLAIMHDIQFDGTGTRFTENRRATILRDTVTPDRIWRLKRYDLSKYVIFRGEKLSPYELR